MMAGGNQSFINFMNEHSADTDADGERWTDLSLRERYESDGARLYREVLKARAEGREEPKLKDLPKVERKKNPDRKMSGSTFRPLGAGVPKELIIPSYGMRFIGGLRYWSHRLIFLPLRNNRNGTAALLVLFIISKKYRNVTPTIESEMESSLRNQMLFVASILIRAIPPIITTLSLLSLKWFKDGRQQAFNSAAKSFHDRVQIGRAKRNPLYDLYFPPNTSVGVGSHVDKAAIFYPDILVDKTAYATVMGKLSDAGILVIVVNADPLRMPPRTIIGKADVSAVVKIGFEITNMLGIQVNEWITMGHGDGAATALAVTQAAALEKSSSRSSRCVLWAPTLFRNISKVSKSTSSEMSIMTICASNDPICEGLHHLAHKLHVSVPPSQIIDEDRGHRNQNHNEKNLQTHIHNIIGGNHSGFAHYGLAVFPRKDGQRTITLDDQQKECLEKSLDFILDRKAATGKKD
eukprot:CAMPEP_0194108532 /NCGR_PEP_ID=MMETSP0150-20130528/8202_1 /TAXON_ID=122233 /ORGANISM="Chaetoceros debilis, Strain MM31A-1" /LENGTH=463 /DNA_ID=CAMNT_0038797251 /DNA_START=283 /DNA_END=1674 /DNA_ORIENTATION=+